MINITIPTKPILINHARKQVKIGKRLMPIKTKKAKDFEQLVRNSITKEIKEKAKELKGKELKVLYFFGLSDFYTKKHAFNKKAGDIDNFIKILQDAIFKELDIDDCFIISLQAWKSHALSSYTTIGITEHENTLRSK